jgi:zinc protease
MAIDILCDIMQNATLPPDELHKELDVIRREMDMNQDDPGRRAGRRLFESAYTKSPYRFTIIGYPDIFNTLKPEDILGYYREQYVPNNIFYVVTGDIKIGRSHRANPPGLRQNQRPNRCRRWCSPANRARPPRATSSRKRPIELGYFHFAWHIPDIRHPDTPALDILAALLGSGRSSRLFREVREKKGLVTSADAWTYSPGEQGLFGMSAVMAADKFAARATPCWRKSRACRRTRAQAELAKVIKQFAASTLATRKTMQGQAQDLGSNWMAASDLNFSERYLAAARRSLRPPFAARGAPILDARQPHPLRPAAGRRRAQGGGNGAVSVESATQKIVFPNGLRLLVKEDHRLPFRRDARGLSSRRAGRNRGQQRADPTCLQDAAARHPPRSAEQIATDHRIGGRQHRQLRGQQQFWFDSGSVERRFQNRASMFLPMSCSTRPFPPDAFAREQGIQLELIRSQRDHLLQSCNQAMRKALFGAAGYGLDPLGTESSVGNLRAADAAAFYQRLAVPDNCVSPFMATCPPRGEKAIQQAFGRWKKGAACPLPELSAPR